MVRLVRAGRALRAVAKDFGVDVSTVHLWVRRSFGERLDRFSFADRKRGRAWNRVSPKVEQRILRMRTDLHEHSVLGEYGANAIKRGLHEKHARIVVSRATINRVLQRH